MDTQLAGKRKRDEQKRFQAKQQLCIGEAIYFGSKSKSPFHLLSNFAAVLPSDGSWIDIGDGNEYPSTEHAFQAQKFIPSDRKRFAVGGDLSTFDAYKIVVLSKTGKSHTIFKTLNPKLHEDKGNVGVIAKMVTHKDRYPLLGLTLMNPPFEPNDQIWMKLLQSKFSIPRFRNVLLPLQPFPIKGVKDAYLSTAYDGNQYLVEFSKSAMRFSVFYGGLIDKATGELHGQNRMGLLLMELRDHLKSDTPLNLQNYNYNMDSDQNEDNDD
jgi:predicted NAD-dependent protein-ADP-ribosyltransferase YbiA (DUF1768 family)